MFHGQLGKRAHRRILRRRFRRTHQPRTAPARARRTTHQLWRADKPQGCVIFVTMKTRLGERRVGGERRFFESDRVIIATQRMPPGVTRRRPPTGRLKIAPRDSPLDRPTLVSVVPLIQRSPQTHRRLNVKFPIPRMACVTARIARRQKHVELRVRRIELELIVTGTLRRRFEKQFKHIASPQRAIVLAHRGE